ncbi:MAG: diacylglycerol kinase [Sphingomonadales bacterium BRH_c3]|nr:MAG: diacylglycerol kinase [Sphingomonadales bacterium BRH_c3]
MNNGLFLIYARAANGVIGKDGKLPWHLSADLKRFKSLTLGNPMIMGRKTFEGFPAPLPGRRHVVLTRDRGWSAEGAEVAHSRTESLQLAGDSPVAVIGGAEIFALFEQEAERIELTEVHAHYEGDTHMPPIDRAIWQEVSREDHEAAGDNPAYSFVTYERRRESAA